MGKLGKILAPIVAVLAIAAAVFSVLINGGFKKYQARASKLAETVAATTGKLDAGTNTGTAAKVKFTKASGSAKESGTLSYQDFKTNQAGFDSTLQAATTLAGNVAAQRDNLADAIATMTITLGAKEEQLPADDLKAMASCEAGIKLAQDFATALRKQRDDLAKGVQAFARSLSIYGVDAASQLPAIIADAESEEKSVRPVDVASAIAKVNDAILALQSRRQALETAIQSARANIPEYNWQANLSGIAGSDYKAVLANLADDLKAINAKLVDLRNTKAALAKCQQEKAAAEDTIAELKRNIEAKDKLIADQKATIQRLDPTGESQLIKKVLKNLSEIDPITRGTVLLDNREWNYVVISLGETQVATGAEVVISKDGKYLASGVVKKTEAKISTVDITRRMEATIPEGALVSMGSNVKNAAK